MPPFHKNYVGNKEGGRVHTLHQPAHHSQPLLLGHLLAQPVPLLRPILNGPLPDGAFVHHLEPEGPLCDLPDPLPKGQASLVG